MPIVPGGLAFGLFCIRKSELTAGRVLYLKEAHTDTGTAATARPDDEKWMRRALELAGRARGQTSPNPMVGAVVVNNGRMVGEGYHHRAGESHAEVLALQMAGEAAREAELYVTLEPCVHYGRTPPCLDAVLRAGVRRVVVAMTDPDPRVQGRGLAGLRRAGIAVTEGVMEREARRLNAAYITYQTKLRPHVVWKAALTMDGKTATKAGLSRWITGEPARELVHQMRSEADAIMVGAGTVLADNPELTARLPGKNVADIRQPVRIIIDSHLRSPLSARCFSPELPGRTIIAAVEEAPPAKVAAFEERHISVWQGPADKSGRVDLALFLSHLAQLEITNILLEGGATLAGSMFDRQLIDECRLFFAPLFFGGGGAIPALAGLGVEQPAEAPRLVDPESRWVGRDLLISGLVAYQSFPAQPGGESNSADSPNCSRCQAPEGGD